LNRIIKISGWTGLKSKLIQFNRKVRKERTVKFAKYWTKMLEEPHPDPLRRRRRKKNMAYEFIRGCDNGDFSIPTVETVGYVLKL
jgi:hypothetical protein